MATAELTAAEAEPTTPRGLLRRLRRRDAEGAHRSIGLRRRILLIFTIGSLTLSAFLAVTTYGLTRSNVVQQRDGTAVDTARKNAQVVQNNLRGNPPNIQDALDALRGFQVQRRLIWYRQEWW